LKRTVKKYIIRNPEDLPSEKTICTVTNEYEVLLEFDVDTESYRQSVGERLKEKLTNHLVRIYLKEPFIKISRLISHEEIEANADFFEQCAKDYRDLATKLIYNLAHHLKITLDKDFPWLTLNQVKASKQAGVCNNWNYYRHGFHIQFENNVTGQGIEAPIMFGHDFGELDPYFFSEYITSTPKYHPLPVTIYEPFHDGERILTKMLELGKFESIPSNWPNKQGIVVKDKNKIEVKVFDASKNYAQKPKFNLLKFLGIKK
jgi:hypothetical protein